MGPTMPVARGPSQRETVDQDRLSNLPTDCSMKAILSCVRPTWFAAVLAAVAIGGVSPAQASVQKGVVLDGASQAAFEASAEKMAKTLSVSDRKAFDLALEMFAEFSPSAAKTRKRLNGAPAAVLLGTGRKMLEEFDQNGDGEVDAKEKAAEHGRLLKDRMKANELAAVATMRNLVAAQYQVLAMGLIDSNGNDCGEFGFFGEMTGATKLRDKTGLGSVKMSPPVLSPRFKVKGQRVERMGYVYQIWLPGTNGGAVAEAKDGGVDVHEMPDSTMSEVCFVAYAWPVEQGKTGNRVFVIDQSGDVIVSDNVTQKYSGTKKTPTAFSAAAAGVREFGTDLMMPKKRNDDGAWTVQRVAPPRPGR